MFRISHLALLLAVPGVAQAQEVAGLLSPQVEFSTAAGMDGGQASLGVFIPYAFTAQTIGFGDVRVNSYSDGTFQGSFGLGVRQQVNSDWVIGANAYYDVRGTAHDNTFQQVSGGIEALSNQFEFRANAYLPIGDVTAAESAYDSLLLENGILGYRRGQEVAMYGLDFEAGVKFPILGEDNPSSVKLFAGAFTLGSDEIETITGVKARAELSVANLDGFAPGSTFTIGAQGQYAEDQFSAGVFAKLRVPLGGADATVAGNDLLTQGVERSSAIATRVGAYGEREDVLIDGHKVGALTYVSAEDGTASAINDIIAAAGDGAVIFASGEIAVDETLVLASNQFLIGGGGVVNLKSSGTGAEIVLGNDGAATVLRAAQQQAIMRQMARAAAVADSGAVDVLKLADGNTVTTLSIIGGRNGIVADGTTGSSVTNVTVAGVEANGLTAQGAKDLTVTKFSVTNAGGNGVALVNSQNVSVTGYTASGISGGGFSSFGGQSVAVSSVKLTDVGTGFAVDGTKSFSLETGIVNGANAAGLTLDNAVDASVSQLLVNEAGQSGVAIEGTTGAKFTDVTVKGAGADGFSVAGSSGVELSNASIANVSGNGVAFTDVTGAGVTNVSIAKVGADGVNVTGGEGVSVAKVTVDNASGNGFAVDATKGFSLDTASVTGAKAAGLAVSESSKVGVDGLLINDVGTNGASVVGSASVDLTNVFVDQAGVDGFVVDNTTGFSLDTASVNKAGAAGIVVADSNGVAVNTLAIKDGGANGASVFGSDGVKLADVSIVTTGGKGVAVANTKGFTLDTAAIGNTTGSGIDLINATTAVLADVALKKVGGAGITVSGGTGISATTIGIIDVGGNALTVTGAKSVVFDQLGVTTASGNAVSVADTTGFTLKSASLSGVTGTGIDLSNVTTAALADVLVEKVGGAGIIVANGDGLVGSNVGVTDAGGAGVTVTESQDVDFNGLYVDTVAGNGVTVTDTEGFAVTKGSVVDATGNAFDIERATDIALADLDILRPSLNGVLLRDVNGFSLANSTISDLPICQDNTLCEFAYSSPNDVPNSAINAIGASNVTITDVAMSNVTYGAFFASTIENVDWENVVTNQSSNISIDGLSITNSRREALMFVGADNITVNDLLVDNSALSRDMDLVVFQSSGNATLTNATLIGGVNGLMFVNALGLEGIENDVTVENVDISNTSRAGIFMNPISNIDFKDVTISNAGTNGIFAYGSEWMGGPVSNITFDNVVIDAPTDGALYFMGPMEDIDGDITVTGTTNLCDAVTGPWSGTELTQNAGQVFTVNGVEVDTAWIEAC